MSSKDRKGWESKYEPRYQWTYRPREKTKLPMVDSLPANRWVTLRTSNLPEGFVGFEKDIMPWLKNHNIKLQNRLFVNMSKDPDIVEKVEVFLFKRVKDAVLFKLTWG